jgi:nitroimidazol reductase NimA-like FMN-containing flavoprotein (pyridoxamine 5'-phosphate oxidase superfamily)
MRTLTIENREEINQIIRSCKTCFVSLSDNNIPYVIPMNFALDNDDIILHMAQSGKKWDILKKNPQVCISWVLGEKITWQDVGVACSYRVKSKSVIVDGRAEIINDYSIKVKCMENLMAQYSNLPFKFSAPSINNVGVVIVHIEKISGKKFGAKAITPWKKPDPNAEDE